MYNIWFLAALISAVICLVIARDKGSSSGWLFVGFFLPIPSIVLIASACCLKEQEALQRKIDDLQKQLSRLEFESTVKTGSPSDTSLCTTCIHFRGRHGLCRAFERNVTAPALKCPRHAEPGAPEE